MQTFQEYCKHRDEQLAEMAVAGRKWCRPENEQEMIDLATSEDPPTYAQIADQTGFSTRKVHEVLARSLTPDERKTYKRLTREKTKQEQSERAKEQWEKDYERMLYVTKDPEHHQWLAGMSPGEAPVSSFPSELAHNVARHRRQAPKVRPERLQAAIDQARSEL